MAENREDRVRQLTEAMKEASEASAQPKGSMGFAGMGNLWGFVASRIIDMVEQIARESVNQYFYEKDEQANGFWGISFPSNS